MADKKIAIVTGGNRGMGFETCRQLGRLSFEVILCCRDPQAGELAAATLRNEGLSVEAFRLDLTKPEEIAALVMHARRVLRRVDALINNAGLYLESGGANINDRISAFDARLEVVRATLETNLIGPFALSQGIIGLDARSRPRSRGELDECYGSAIRHGRRCTRLPLGSGRNKRDDEDVC